jgi:hypothetical protein
MGFVQRFAEVMATLLCWFFELFERPEPLPRITNFRWSCLSLTQARATLHFDDGDVRHVYSDDTRWYYFGGFPINSERLANHLTQHQLKQRSRLYQRQEAGLDTGSPKGQ